MPSGVVPTLGPDATGVGHVFWYTVEGEAQAAGPALAPGLVHPLSAQCGAGCRRSGQVGGDVQQYQIDVDPNRCAPSASRFGGSWTR